MKQYQISLSSPEKWTDALTGLRYSFAHTWESCYAMKLTTGYETFLYVYESDKAKVVCPLSERDYHGFIDIVTPYGFSGFVSTGSDDSFQQHWTKFASEKKYICGYIGLNPVFENPSLYAPEDLFISNTLYVFNLELSLATLFENLSQNRKRQLKSFNFHAENFVFDKGQLSDFFLANYFDFFALKNSPFMAGFSTESLNAILASENVFMVGYQEKGELKAVSVFSHTPFIADYLFNISVDEGKVFAVPLIWFAVHYFKSKNVRYLNLGGGVQAGDSIAQFKTRFGATEYPLKSLKQVFNAEIYRRLCEEKGADPCDKQSYFPSYRKK